MKANKKALCGMAIAMTLSLGTLGGIQGRLQAQNEASIQQVALGCYMNASLNEGRVSSGWKACSGLAFGLACCTGGAASSIALL